VARRIRRRSLNAADQALAGDTTRHRILDISFLFSNLLD